MTEAEASSSMSNCGCFPVNHTTPGPKPPSGYDKITPHGDHCVVGGGFESDWCCTSRLFPSQYDLVGWGFWHVPLWGCVGVGDGWASCPMMLACVTLTVHGGSQIRVPTTSSRRTRPCSPRVDPRPTRECRLCWRRFLETTLSLSWTTLRNSSPRRLRRSGRSLHTSAPTQSTSPTRQCLSIMRCKLAPLLSEICPPSPPVH